jgi:uncharacterized protein YndB with AHSA1/START domain
MSSPVVIRVTHKYNASADRVFDAWLDPKQAKRFFFATRTGNIMRCEIVPQVGGEFFVTDRRPTAEGDESVMDLDHRGTYLEIDRPRRLVFDFNVAPYTDPPTRVTLDFNAQGPVNTELVLTHDMGDTPMAHAFKEQSWRGWSKMLEKLERELFPKRIAL